MNPENYYQIKHCEKAHGYFVYRNIFAKGKFSHRKYLGVFYAKLSDAQRACEMNNEILDEVDAKRNAERRKNKNVRKPKIT